MLSGFSFVFLAGLLSLAAGAEEVTDACLGEVCPDGRTKSSTLLQVTKKGAKPQVKMVAGVPIFNHDKLHRTVGVRLLQQEGDELFDFVVRQKEGGTTEELGLLCDADGITCLAKGTGRAEGGLGMVSVQATQAGIEALMLHLGSTLEFVEPDADSYEVPEEDVQHEIPTPRGGNTGPASWGLDRIDQQSGTNSKYRADPNGGHGVHVYVTDTGIRTSHQDFSGRADNVYQNVGNGREVCQTGQTNCGIDRKGHGTHCAGTVGGDAFGVAKKVSLHGVKILSDGGTGAFSWWVDSLDWIAMHGQRPAVISASMGGTSTSNFVKDAVNSVTDKGILVVVSAGNDNHNACLNQPAFVPNALTVGSTDSHDQRAWDSNYGKCLDIYAPGVRIVSASHQNDRKAAKMSGTSMACPHVSGAAALLLQENHEMTPRDVTDALVSASTKDKVSDAMPQSPNALLFVAPHTDGPAPTTSPGPVVTPSPGTGDATMVLIGQKKKCQEDPPNGWGDLGSGLSKKKCLDKCSERDSCGFVVFRGGSAKKCTSFATCTLEWARGVSTFRKQGGGGGGEVFEMVPFTVPDGHRCAGQPPGQWGDLGKVTKETCQEKCLAKTSCAFAVYKMGSRPSNGRCTSFAKCNSTEAKPGFVVWQKKVEA